MAARGVRIANSVIGDSLVWYRVLKTLCVFRYNKRMHKRVLLSTAVVALAACSQVDTSQPTTEQSSSSNVTIGQAVPMHQSGYLLRLETQSGWSLKQNTNGPIIDLSVDTLKTCVKEVTGTPCTSTGLLVGMQVDILGSGHPAQDYPTMDVTDIRIIGTSLTFNEVGDLSGKPDGIWRLTYGKEGEKKNIRILLSKETICQDDGLTTPCGRWMEGRGGSVTGEIRQGEQAVRATWIDLP